MNRDQIILQLQQDYMKRREDNLRLYEQRVDEACERCPGLRELLNARHALVLGGIRASLVERKEGRINPPFSQPNVTCLHLLLPGNNRLWLTVH